MAIKRYGSLAKRNFSRAFLTRKIYTCRYRTVKITVENCRESPTLSALRRVLDSQKNMNTVRADVAALMGAFSDKVSADVAPGADKADCPFHVRVTAEDLRIWKGNGTDTAWTGKCVPPGVYTIVEVKRGKGSEAGWGRLKSGAGWIALLYAKRV